MNEFHFLNLQASEMIKSLANITSRQKKPE